MQKVIKFLVSAPGTSEPAVTYGERWKAEAEATKLREEHGYDVAITPVIRQAGPTFNPWAAAQPA